MNTRPPDINDSPFRVCFNDIDPDGLSEAVATHVLVWSTLTEKAVKHIIAKSLEKFDYRDYDSRDEFIEAVMDDTGFRWGLDIRWSDIYLEI